MPMIHESETVLLRANQSWPRAELHGLLTRRGYLSIDDFYSLDRRGKIPPWQSVSVVAIDVLRQTEPVYESEEDVLEGKSTTWDELKAEFLLATLPEELIETFCAEIEALAAAFSLQPICAGIECLPAQLATTLKKHAAELAHHHAPCGSKELAILIQESYGR
jgi:hypothetical protein